MSNSGAEDGGGIPRGISLDNLVYSEVVVAPCVPLPVLYARKSNRSDVSDQASKISKLLQATDVSYLEMEQMESMYNEHTKSLNNILLKHDELLLTHTSDIKKANEKITAECEEFYENYKQKSVQLETENKLLQQRENELNKKQDELKKKECKILKDKSKLELKKKVREKLSCCKQLVKESQPSKKEAEDLKMEIDTLHKRTTELEEQLSVENQSLHNESMKLEIALQAVEDEEGVDLDEKLTNLQCELMENNERLEELKKLDKDYTLAFGIKNDELQDARKELIEGMKTNPNRASIRVKTLDQQNENAKGGLCKVEELWNSKEKREASLKEGIEYMMKKWKTEKKQIPN